jgi:hypothetical protein
LSGRACFRAQAEAVAALCEYVDFSGDVCFSQGVIEIDTVFRQYAAVIIGMYKKGQRGSQLMKTVIFI